MFLDELSPVAKELVSHPVAFLGGLASGLFRLNLSDDPVKSWLEQQTGASISSPSADGSLSNGRGSGPQSISID
jgi:hypothetical protein